MAAGSLLALLDDIASILDDVSLMTQVAAKKTSGVLGDDLALNAQQVTGVSPDRELPVVWAVAKGSFKNKGILVPAALLISAFANWAILPLLMLGGAFLCFEGFEKLAHKYMRHDGEHHHAPGAVMLEPNLEQEKIKGAVRTDFILSAEIIVITLGTVATAPFSQQVLVLILVAILMTVGVYGLVAGIVKLDDAGLHLSKRAGESVVQHIQRWLGHKILIAAPVMMKTLSVVGTAAMFMVGGSILSHGISFMHHLHEAVALKVQAIAVLNVVLPILLDALLGLISGGLVLLVVKLVGWLRPGSGKTH